MAHLVEAIGIAHAEDIDSTQLSGAVIALSGAQPSDRLNLTGFTLHSENGHPMIGNTGIELVGGAYAKESGTLTLSGHASRETYAAVLQSLMLESGSPSGLAAGTRSIGVVLLDSEGAAATRQSVDVVVDGAEPGHAEGQGFASNGSETMYDGTHADIALLTSYDGSDMGHESSGSWTEVTDRSDAPATTPLLMELDQPVPENVQIIDDFQADLGRVNWS